MLLIPLLKKEVHWSKRNILILGFLLILVPATFGWSTIAFQETVPEDIPVAVVAQNDNVTDDDLNQVESALVLNANPKVVNSKETARENQNKAVTMLEREEVYAVIEVPPDPSGTGDTNFTLTIDGSIAPIQEAAPFIVELVEGETDRIEGSVNAEVNTVGEENGLGEFLYPAYMMALLIFFAFTYFPYELRRDSHVLDRLRVETTVEAVVASKLLYIGVLMLLPLAVFHAISWNFGYSVNTTSPVALGVLLITFLGLSTISGTVMVLSRFSGAGQFVNLLGMLGILAGSAIAFPRGSLSSIRPIIAQFIPVHYAGVTVRSMMLKDVPAGQYTDMILVTVGMFLLGTIALKGSIIYYRRTS
jgi:ABC-2 type transport system permease protein